MCTLHDNVDADAMAYARLGKDDWTAIDGDVAKHAADMKTLTPFCNGVSSVLKEIKLIKEGIGKQT